MVENLKMNISTIGSEEATSCYRKYNFRQKLVFSKLISTSPEEQIFFWEIKVLESYSEFEPTIFGRVVKTAFYVSGGNFCYKEYFLEKQIIPWIFFWHWANIFRILNKKTFGTAVEAVFNLSRGTFWEENVVLKIF